MSRSGFHEIYDYDRDAILSMGRTKGQILSASRGKRGQAFFRKALAALDKMEDKRLAGGTFGVAQGGCMCLLTSLATETGRASVLTPGRDLEYDDTICDDMADAFNVAPILLRDLVWDNDENAPRDPASRWQWMRDRIEAAITKERD
jgi:hypothetical protein